jgi:polysaccharide pyruvyl transferase WcaK-like protein
MIIEIKGAQFANQGAHLMLRAVLERLTARRPDAGIALAPGPNSPYGARARLQALQKLPLRKGPIDLTAAGYHWPEGFNLALARYGVVTEARVDAVLDISGFAYGDRWGGRALKTVGAELTRFGRHGKPYLFLPQAFGPFSPSPASRQFGRALRHAALICARDDQSLAHLSGLGAGGGEALLRCPDLTLGVPGESAAAARWGIDASCALLIPNVRMLDPGPARPGWQARYLPLLEALAAECRRRGLAVKVVNHAGQDDAPLCATLAQASGGIEVIDERDPLALKGLIGAAGVVISSRYHGCVNALSQGVPCLGTSWSHKYGALFEEFGVGSRLLTDPDEPQAMRRLTDLLDQGRVEPAGTAERRVQLVAQVEALWERVFDLLPDAASPAR